MVRIRVRPWLLTFPEYVGFPRLIPDPSGRLIWRIKIKTYHWRCLADLQLARMTYSLTRITATSLQYFILLLAVLVAYAFLIALVSQVILVCIGLAFLDSAKYLTHFLIIINHLLCKELRWIIIEFICTKLKCFKLYL